MFCLYRVWFIVLLIVFSNLSILHKQLCFITIQLSFIIYLLAWRPLSSFKELLWEIIYQILFFLLAVILIFINVENDWSSLCKNAYFALLLAGPTIGCIISLVFLIVTCAKKLKRRKMTKVEEKPFAELHRNRLNQHEEVSFYHF